MQPSRPTSRSLRALGAAALALLAAPAASSATVLAYEGFGYPLLQVLPGSSGFGSFGWNAPWVGSNLMQSNSPTLAYPAAALAPTGIALENRSVGEAWRDLLPPIPSNSTSDLWVSFMQKSTLAATSAFVSLDPSTVSLPSITFNKTAGSVVFSIGGASSPAIAGSGLNNVDFFVLHLSQYNGVTSDIDFYLDPAAPITGSTIPSFSVLAFPSSTALNLSRFYYRSDSGEWLDEIRVGTEQADVAAVPAPGAAALIAVGSLVCLRRRRREP